MLSSAQRSVPTIKQFRQPYFLDIATDGTVLSACDSFSALISKKGIPDFLGGNFMDLFSRIGKAGPDGKPLQIHWVISPRHAPGMETGGWQLTGICDIASNDA